MTLKDMLIAGKLAGGGGGEEPSGTKQISISANGTVTENVKDYASAEITTAVSNSYTAGDEGKVVSSGALVSQTAHADVTPTTSDQTIDTTTNNSIKVKGDADLVAGNIKKDVDIFGVIGSYEGGGGGITVDDIAQNLAPSGDIVLGSGVTEIKDHAFQGKPITSVKGASVTKIGTHALNDTQITSIADADFPSLGVGTRYDVVLRLPTTCKSIKLSGPKIALASGSYALRECKGLQTVEFPYAAYDVGTTYNGLGVFALYSCTALTMADCGYVQNIGANAFGNSTNFGTLILRYSSIVSLANVNAFNGTKFASGGTGGTIYIPKALYDHLGDGTSLDYKAANNWSTVNGYGTITWAQIEGSPYEL